MPSNRGLKLKNTQRVFSPELLEANALESGNFMSALPWIVRLQHFADETGSSYWKQRAKFICEEYGFDLGLPVLVAGGANNQLGERTPPENLEEANQIFVSSIHNKQLNLKRLWGWTLDNFVDKINYKYEWVAGLLFFSNQQLLLKESDCKVTPTTAYATQMRNWFEQVWCVECKDDQINDYRYGFFKSANFNYNVWLNDVTGGPSKKDLYGDQTTDGFLRIKNLCKLLERNFNLNDFLVTP